MSDNAKYYELFYAGVEGHGLADVEYMDALDAVIAAVQKDDAKHLSEYRRALIRSTRQAAARDILADTDFHVLDDLKRDELGVWEEAAWALDDWLMRMHGITSRHHSLGVLLHLLDEAGYDIAPVRAPALTTEEDTTKEAQS